MFRKQGLLCVLAFSIHNQFENRFVILVSFSSLYTEGANGFLNRICVPRTGRIPVFFFSTLKCPGESCSLENIWIRLSLSYCRLLDLLSLIICVCFSPCMFSPFKQMACFGRRNFIDIIMWSKSVVHLR